MIKNEDISIVTGNLHTKIASDNNMDKHGVGTTNESRKIFVDKTETLT